MGSPDPRETYRQEAQELLEQLEKALLDLEHLPADSELIDTAFRALHTIKGSGAMFGFDAVAAFTHHVETAFDQVRQGRVPASRDLIAVGLAAKDHMRILIEQPEAADPDAAAMILAELGRIIAAAATATDAGPAAEAAPVAWRIRMALPVNAMAMGTNPLLLLDELRSLGQATVIAHTDAVPPIEALDPTGCHLRWEILLTTDQPRAAIEDVFLFVIDEMTLEIEPVETHQKRLGEILIERGDATREAVDAALDLQQRLGHAAAGSAEEKPAGPRPAPRERSAAKDGASIRVPAAKLDDLMDRVGELVIAQSRLRQVANASADNQVKSVTEEIERLVLELRDTTMGIRMVPIASLFGRFRRVVHDLSHDLEKQVELNTEGEETELDKTVIERLNDPLVHLIRNAIDHGLERPEQRLAAGKPAAGRIALTARHAGTEVLVTVADDGRGLDRDRIRARAEERGLIAPDAVLSDADLFQVLFQPGFSTAAAITSVSGRGVGMDVVKRTIDELRGGIDIATVPGAGTRMTLRLPLTLAIIDGLLVRVGRSRYVMPLSAVEECVELSPEDDARTRGCNFLAIRGDIVPFLRLRELFAAATPPDRFQKVVVVSSGDQKVGLVVDQVIGDHQTVIKSLSKLHAEVEMFSGATILGDGTTALILDLARLVEYGQSTEERLKAAG